MNTNRKILNNLIAIKFFQIIVTADHEFEGEVFKNKKHWNNDSVLTPENWDHHKATFLEQRMETYKGSYALEEKVKEELRTLKKHPTNSLEHRILKNRYLKYLKEFNEYKTNKL
jgi:alkaline phosphatase